MATPNADRLKIIEVWKTDPIEQANDDLRDVSARMRRVAEINRRVAADLGLEGETAQAASARLDGLASSLESRPQKVDKLAEIQGKAVESGKKAQTGSLEIQSKLKQIDSVFETQEKRAKTLPSAGPSVVVRVQAERDAAHAEADQRAKKVLHVLSAETNELIGSLPDQLNMSPRQGTAARPLTLPKRDEGVATVPGKQVFMGLLLLLIRGRRGRLRNGTLPEMSRLGAPSAAVMVPEAGIRVD